MHALSKAGIANDSVSDLLCMPTRTHCLLQKLCNHDDATNGRPVYLTGENKIINQVSNSGTYPITMCNFVD